MDPPRAGCAAGADRSRASTGTRRRLREESPRRGSRSHRRRSDGKRTSWPLRATDVDRMGHVNNAAYWAAIEHRLAGREPDLRDPIRARLDYRHPIDLGEKVELVESAHGDRYGVAFVVGDVVKAVAVGRAAFRVLARFSARAGATLARWTRHEISRQGIARLAGRPRRRSRRARRLAVRRGGRSRPCRRRGRARQLRPRPRADRGPVLRRRCAVRRNVTEGKARRAR